MSKLDKQWCDPPSGWRYGFPKIWDPVKDPYYFEWLVKEGYPQKEIDRLGDNFWSRHWAVEPEQQEGDDLE
jgi:hypothetical protein